MIEECEHLCTACGGTGNKQAADLARFDRDGLEQPCEHCDGYGYEPCPPKGDLESALRRAEEGAKR